MKRLAAIIVLFSLAFFAWADSLCYRINWNCSYNGEDYSFFRYQLDRESTTGWTVITSDTPNFITYTEEYRDHVLFVQKSPDGIHWSKSTRIIVPASYLIDESIYPSVSEKDSYSFGITLFGGISQQNIVFEDGLLQSSSGMGGKLSIYTAFTYFMGLTTQVNYQLIDYRGFDYEELALLGKVRFCSYAGRFGAFVDFGGGINVVNIANTTCKYPMASVDAGFEFCMFKHVAVSLMGEYSMSFQPDSMNNHFGLFVGVNAQFGYRDKGGKV